jgi:hypothetical protein
MSMEQIVSPVNQLCFFSFFSLYFTCVMGERLTVFGGSKKLEFAEAGS